MTLDTLEKSQEALIQSICAKCSCIDCVKTNKNCDECSLKDSKVCLKQKNSTLMQYLLSLGVMPGCKIKIQDVTPFNDPIVYEIEGKCISLRKNEARHIIVECI